MEKYYVALTEESNFVIAFKAKSEEDLHKKAERIGLHINWMTKEINEVRFKEWKGYKIELP